MNSNFKVLKDADYVIRDSNRIERNSSIVVNGSRIISIGIYDELKKEYEFDEIIDCRGLAVLPGLINTHTHIHETMMRGLGHDLPFHDWCDRLVFPTARAMEDEGEELYSALTKLTAMEAAASGTTAIARAYSLVCGLVLPVRVEYCSLSYRFKKWCSNNVQYYWIITELNATITI